MCARPKGDSGEKNHDADRTMKRNVKMMHAQRRINDASVYVVYQLMTAFYIVPNWPRPFNGNPARGWYAQQ